MSRVYCRVCGLTAERMEIRGDTRAEMKAVALPCGHGIGDDNRLFIQLMPEMILRTKRQANDLCRLAGKPPIHPEVED